MTARKQVTHVNDLEVVTREPALAKHPHPSQGGKLVPFEGVEHVLLEDGTETNICTECGYDNTNVQSVIAHKTAHGDRAPSMYPDETLRTILREVLRAKKTGARNFNEIAASALNDMGVKPAMGERFTSAAVSRLVADHGHRFSNIRVRNPVIAGPPPLTEAAAAVRARVDDVPEAVVIAQNAVAAAQTELLAAELGAMDMPLPPDPVHPNPRIAKTMHTTRVARIHRMLNELARELVFLDNEWSKLQAKAKAYDKLRETLATLGLTRLNDE